MTPIQIILSYISALGTSVGNECKQITLSFAGKWQSVQTTALVGQVRTKINGGVLSPNMDTFYEVSAAIIGANTTLNQLTTASANSLKTSGGVLTETQKTAVRTNLGVTDIDLTGLAAFNPTAAFDAAVYIANQSF